MLARVSHPPHYSGSLHTGSQCHQSRSVAASEREAVAACCWRDCGPPNNTGSSRGGEAVLTKPEICCVLWILNVTEDEDEDEDLSVPDLYHLIFQSVEGRSPRVRIEPLTCKR